MRPLWVKVSVAIALGLGTMGSWKRIVVTIASADHLGLPVSIAIFVILLQVF